MKVVLFLGPIGDLLAWVWWFVTLPFRGIAWIVYLIISVLALLGQGVWAVGGAIVGAVKALGTWIKTGFIGDMWRASSSWEPTPPGGAGLAPR